MVGAARNAGAFGAVPVLGKFRIEIVAAFGRLDKGELSAGGADLVPVDVALPVGNVDALHRHGMGTGDTFMRIDVGKVRLPRHDSTGQTGEKGQ